MFATNTSPSPDSMIESLPSPDMVRRAIKRLIRQAAVLRRLLRVSETRQILERESLSVSGVSEVARV